MTTKHTPGPWYWRISKKGHQVELLASDGMGSFVMGFDRYGMRGAAPCFRVDGMMQRADELAVEIPGQEHNASWNMTLRHPDADLIAAAPDLLAVVESLIGDTEVLKDIPERCQVKGGFCMTHDKDEPCIIARAHAALKKARGEK